MNKNQSTMIRLLSFAIRGDSHLFQEVGRVDWEAVFFEAAAHETHTLIYPLLNKLEPSAKPDAELQAGWRNAALFAAGRQLQYMEEAGRILKALCGSGIPVIALKGLFLRDLYPQPELRTMGDFDLLVNPSDIGGVCGCLEKLGYRKQSEKRPVISYCRPDSFAVELHYSLYDIPGLPVIRYAQAHWWDSSAGASVCGQDILTLSIEDNMIYLLAHMAKHVLYRGLGLRQLCDFVLLVEACSGEIDCGYFREIIGALNLGHFTAAVFGLCRKYFNLKIPEALEGCCPDAGTGCVERLADYIVSSGIYGKKSDGHVFGAMLEKKVRKPEASGGYRKFRILSVFLTDIVFPDPRKLDKRYSYACNFFVLLPAAWLHRILRFILQKETLRSKAGALGIAINTPILAEGRIKLLEELGLL